MALKKILQVQRLIGLSDRDIPSLQQRFGKNIFKTSRMPPSLVIFLNIVREPMFILLCLACAVYFLRLKDYKG